MLGAKTQSPPEGGSSLDRDQLEALRRQIEEDYRLDIAAIERLQRRYSAFNYVPAAPSGGPSDSVLRGAYTAPTDWPKYEGGRRLAH